MKHSRPPFAIALGAPLVVLGRRVRAHWRLALVLLAGVITATTLLASAPIFLGAVKEIGLQHSLRTEQTGVLDTAVRVPHRPLGPATLESLDKQVQDRAEETLGDAVTLEVMHIRSPAMAMATPPDRHVPGGVVANLQSFSAYEERTSVVEGRLPRYPSLQEPGVIEAAIGGQSSRATGLKLGDRVTLASGSLAGSRSVIVHITGITEAKDISDTYWSFAISPFAMQVDLSTGADIPMMPLLVAGQTFLQEAAPALSGSVADYWWFFYVDPSRFHGAEVTTLRGRLDAWESDLALTLPGSDIFTGLGDTLASFEQKLFFSQIPILVLLLLLVVLVLYYITLVANLVVDRHMEEVALLRSRGAKGSQLLAVYLWEAAAITIIAALLAPLIALAIVPLLGKAPGFASATGGALLPVRMTATAWLVSAGAAALCFIALLIPGLRGARFNLLNARARVGRPPRSSALHKYNLDLFLLALTALLYWELTQRGSLVTRRLFGDQSTDYLLLLMPAMLMAGAALLVLRVLPLLLRILSRIAASTARVPLVLGLWSLARDPVRYVRPAVLLTLVAGLAMFAASFNATIGKSFQDRGRYAAGSDVLISGIPWELSGEPETLATSIEEAPGVLHAAAAFRTGPQSGTATGYELLAVHTTDLQRVSWTRDDFMSEQELFTLLRRLDQGRATQRGLDLPEATEAVGLWVRPAEPYQNMSMWFLIKDAEGRPWRLRAGRLDFDDWQFLSVRTELSEGARLPGPLLLEAILLRELDVPSGGLPFDLLTPGLISSAQVNLSDLTVVTAEAPDGIVLESFVDPSAWRVMATSTLPEKLAPSLAQPRETQTTTEFSWQSASGVGTRGIFPSDFHEPLPVIASRSFLSATGSSVGQVIEVSVAGVPVPAEIVDSVEFFPTLDPREPFLLGNMETLLHQASLFRAVPVLAPTEIWVSLQEDPTEREAFVTWLRDSPYSPFVSQDLGESLARLEKDPLVGASSRGIVFAAFGVLLIVGIGGYLGYVYMSSFRTSNEFAVLKALGLAPARLLIVQALVHGLVLIGSALLGGWVGVRAHEAMITFLSYTERGGEIQPPLSPQADWTGLAVVLAAFTVLLATLVARLVWGYSRTQVWLVLRRGGE